MLYFLEGWTKKGTMSASLSADKICGILQKAMPSLPGFADAVKSADDNMHVAILKGLHTNLDEPHITVQVKAANIITYHIYVDDDRTYKSFQSAIGIPRDVDKAVMTYSWDDFMAATNQSSSPVPTLNFNQKAASTGSTVKPSNAYVVPNMDYSYMVKRNKLDSRDTKQYPDLTSM
jgi:hypothetical protein